MPIETTFNIAGVTRCPEFKPGFLEPADVNLKYLDGSDLFVGMPAITYTWPVLPDDEVALIWALYDTLITGVDPYSVAGNPVTITVPDYLNGGWRTTTAYMTEPTGTAGGNGTRDFTVTFYNLHEQSLLTAMESPGGSLWDYMQQGADLKIGTSQYGLTGWQF